MTEAGLTRSARGAVAGSPPVPPMVFRVGVTGHRPNRLEADTAALEGVLRRLLEAIGERVRREAREGEPVPRLRVVSSLAEGVDRMAAGCALELGYGLQVPLPLPREDYEADFADAGSVAEFRGLLGRAEAVFELEAGPQHRDFAYRAAGHLVLQQSDLLLAVWDGQPGRGVGGTSELVDVAEGEGRAVLCVGAVAPYGLRYSRGSVSVDGDGEAAEAALAYVGGTLRAEGAMAADSERRYRGEQWPRRIATTSYTLLRLLGERRWRRTAVPEPAGAVPEIRSAVLVPYFRWMDALALEYGERSRSAAVRMQLLALLAVVSAILILPFEESRVAMQVLSFTEALSLVALLVEAARVNRSDWHARWLLYRSLAEKIRCLDFLAPLGETVATAGRQRGFAGRRADEEREFAAVFLEGVERELGLADARVDAAFRTERAGAVVGVVREQAAFQHRVAHRYEAMEGALHGVGVTLFGVAVLLALLDVFRAVGPELFERVNAVGLTGVRVATAAAILPALGAALAGLAAQGEYKRLAMRADVMSRTLLELLREFEGRGGEQARAGGLRAVQRFAVEAAEVLLSEVQDWQVLVAAKPPSLPT